MNTRGRSRSEAQRAGTSYAYFHSNQDIVDSHDPTHIMQNPGQAWFVPIKRWNTPPGPLKYPPTSDVNLLLQNEDALRANLMSITHNAYSWRLDPIPYIESQLTPYEG